MSDHGDLYSALAAIQPADAPDAPVSVPALVKAWLERGPAVFAADDRASLEALCRQIDVRKKVSVGYGAGFARLDPEEAADAAVVSGLVAVLLGNAAGVGDPAAHIDGAVDDGWGLKCTNSALKALDLRDDLPHTGELRVWAMDVLDRHASGVDA